MDNALSEKLIAGMDKLGRFRVVANPKEADAIMRGTCLESRRLKKLHSEIYITDRSGTSVWQDSVHRPFNPPTLGQAVDETATLVLQDLGDSVKEASSK